MIYYPPKAVLESGCRFLKRKLYYLEYLKKIKMNPGTFSIIWLFHSFRHQSRAGKGGQIFFLFLINIYKKSHLSGKKRSVLQGTLMGVPRQLPMLRAQFESLELKEKVKMVERRLMSKKAKVRWGFVSDKSGGRDFSRRGRGKQQLPGAVFFIFVVCLFGGDLRRKGSDSSSALEGIENIVSMWPM